MHKAKTICTEHKDLIHDVSYDYHGRRIATCSSDQHVKIWDLLDGEWKCTATLKTHTGSVWRVVWAHPEFGQVIATCSFDRTATIWEELPGSGGQWIRRGMLVDSRTSVQDIKFAPRHLGLQVALCSSDGVVRIYEAQDIMNLNNWPLKDKFDCKQSCSCLSWNPSRVHPPMIAVGSDDTNPNNTGGKVLIYEYSDTTRSWTKVSDSTVTDPVKDVAFAPNLGRSYHILGVAGKDVSIYSLKPITSTRKDAAISQSGLIKIQQMAQFDEHSAQVWRLSWNITGTILASSGDDGCVRLWKANYLDNWKPIAGMKGDGSTTQLAETRSGSSTGSNGSVGSSARYMRLGNLAHPGQVVWH